MSEKGPGLEQEDGPRMGCLRPGGCPPGGGLHTGTKKQDGGGRIGRDPGLWACADSC